MPDELVTIQNVPVLVCDRNGQKLTSEAIALDLIGEAMGLGAEVILVPVERFEDEFFQLKSGLAGQIVQKCVTYQRRLVIMGDISRHVANSRAFRDFVYEANKGYQVWFITNRQELDERLSTL
jgi:Domain of unknown function (DUF4180)